jgi:hypothetical protein
MSTPEQAPTEAVDTASPETPAAPDPVEAATPEDAGRRGAEQDKYRQEVSNLLDAYEQRTAEQARAARQAKEAAKPVEEPQGLLEGESWDSIYANQPEDVQRAMSSLRASFTRKTQELANERRLLKAQNEAFRNSGIIDDLQKAVANAPEEFDPFNAEHVQAAIDARVALRLKEVLDPLQKSHQQHEAQARYETFKEQHPDLVSDDTIKQGVYKALQSDPNLKLQDAYWRVKGQMLAEKERQESERRTVRRRAAQRAAKLTGEGRRPGVEVVDDDLRGKDAWTIYQALKSRQP